MAHIVLSYQPDKGKGQQLDMILMSRKVDLEAIFEKMRAVADKEFDK